MHETISYSNVLSPYRWNVINLLNCYYYDNNTFHFVFSTIEIRSYRVRREMVLMRKRKAFLDI